MCMYYIYLEPETSTLKWLFQLDDSKSLHETWLFHQTSIKKWLFGVPGIYIYVCLFPTFYTSFFSTTSKINPFFMDR